MDISGDQKLSKAFCKIFDLNFFAKSRIDSWLNLPKICTSGKCPINVLLQSQACNNSKALSMGRLALAITRIPSINSEINPESKGEISIKCLLSFTESR